jgi:glycosyltransferase involved in cell wall biosynthesis
LIDSVPKIFHNERIIKMDSKTQLSVIIPVYNGELYLAEAIDSVLAQNYRAIEVIVVDDGSTDGTASIANSYGSFVRYCYQSNLGTAAAMNRGADLACGEYLAFLGADDIWPEDRIRVQLEAFNAHPDVEIVSGYVKQFFSPEMTESTKKRIRFSADLIPGHVIPAMLINRQTFFRVGLFETQWTVGAEMSWYLRSQETGLKIMILPDLVLLRRIHESNKGIVKRSFINQRAQILKAALDRRRVSELDRERTSNSIDDKTTSDR